MTTEEFSSYAQAKGYHCVSNATFGVHHGYPFAAIFKSGAGTVTVQFKVEGKITGAILKGLRKQLPKGCTMAPNNQSGIIAVQCTAGQESLTGNLEQVLDLAVRCFREGQLTVSDVCPICKGPSCDALAFLSGYVPVHQACVQGQTQATLDKAEENEVSGNYVTGLIGAILGGLVGSLPPLLCLQFANYYVALLYALIPLAAYKGYQLFKGKMNKAAFVSTLFASLLALPLAQYIGMYIQAFQRLGQLLTPAYVLQAYMGTFPSTNLIMSLIFVALGLWISWGQITRTAKHEVRSAAMVAATLQPYGGGASDAGQPTYAAPSAYKGPELDEK